VANLMEVLNGWRLLFNENSSNVSFNGRCSHKMEEALVTVWQRETGRGRQDLQLLVRVSSGGREPSDKTWLSASRECHYIFEISQSLAPFIQGFATQLRSGANYLAV